MDISGLLKGFQAFWRENSGTIWDEHYEEGLREYREASPHIVLQAFLQLVVNGGGKVTREMALGSRRVDLAVEWEGQKYPIEVKILRGKKTYVKKVKSGSKRVTVVGC
ncbi:MAG: hypothetical protein LBB74_09095 [Chitinispirillales bacterium]|nr:hypothetical protein [Chitinispirillales bacterium]